MSGYEKQVAMAWNMYCQETAKDAHVCDYWEQLPIFVRQHYLEKVSLIEAILARDAYISQLESKLPELYDCGVVSGEMCHCPEDYQRDIESLDMFKGKPTPWVEKSCSDS